MRQSEHTITYLSDKMEDDDRAALYSAERVRIVAEFYGASTGSKVLGSNWQHEYAVITDLAARDRIYYQSNDDGSVDVYYNPSKSAVETLCPTQMTWPSSMIKRVGKLVRKTPGALFTLPFESGDGEVTVFVTDWSSCTAACAVALHRFHPVVREQNEQPPRAMPENG